MDYRIGLDIGTNSVGWGVIRMQYNDLLERYEKQGIVDAGVRMFDKAEIPKTGASLAAPRREARSSRKRLRRRSQRKKAIRYLIISHELLSEDQLQQLYPLQKESIDIWDIRLESLDRVLNQTEWARLLIHLGQRRGFKSNRKSEYKEEETGKVLVNIQENQKALQQYRTVAEMWMKDPKFSQFDKKRNAPGEYLFSVSRHDLQNEIQTIFESQRNLGSSYATADLEEEYISIWSKQLPFASGEDILKKVGYCSLERNERRIPKATYTFQYFILLDGLNKIRVGADARQLTSEERSILIEKILKRNDYFSKKSLPDLTYGDLRKWLALDSSLLFKDLTYDPNEKISKVEKKVFANLKSLYELRKVVETSSNDQSFERIDYDTFSYALTVYKTDEDIRRYLKTPSNLAHKRYEEDLIERLLSLSYEKFGHLSLKAIQTILPYMEDGMMYTEAVQAAGYDITGLRSVKRTLLLPTIPADITNPVVRRALTQTRKVVNAIIKRYGSPLAIHIELARELSKDHQERQQILKNQQANYERNKGAISVLVENGILNPTGYDIVRYKLWKEQGERCAYSLKVIPPSIFFGELKRERNHVPTLEVDHILPYSQSFMDNYHNKVLVYSDENQKKGNQIPSQYLMAVSPEKWTKFEEYVSSNKGFSKQKRQYLLKKDYSSRESDIVKERHLVDTRYATRFMKNFIEQTLLFKESRSSSLTKRVQTVNGKITAHFRKRWGLEKERTETYLHHALDAIVVACTDQHMVTRVTEYYQERERNVRHPYFPWPWEGFRDELLNYLNRQPDSLEISQSIKQNLFSRDYLMVSRMPKHSVTGMSHKQTIRSKACIDEKGKVKTTKRVLLQDIKFDSNGDFKMIGKEQDMATYNAIKERYLSSGGNVKSAFTEPLHKPSKKGKGNVIRKVTVEDQTKSFVRDVNGGVAENGSLVRIDLFEKEGMYYVVPIYVGDTVLKQLPIKISASNRGYYKWVELDENYRFKFSLYANDLIRIVTKDEDRFFYFSYFDNDGNRIKFLNINGPTGKNENRYGVRSIKLIEKYNVSTLGDISLVKSEERQLFQGMKKEVLNIIN